MKDIKISKHSVYIKDNLGDCSYYFPKLYKGIRVTVGYCSDGKYTSFSIRTKKTKTCIWKRGVERMDCIIFDDVNNSVTCMFDNDPKNKSPHTLEFEKDVYEDLKENIPVFFKECGCNFDVLETYGQLIMQF